MKKLLLSAFIILVTIYNTAQAQVTIDAVESGCPVPTALAIAPETITQTGVQLSWIEMGSAVQWEVYVVPVGSAPPVNGTPLNSNNPNYHLADINSNYLLTGLLPGTAYVYYVRAICSPSDTSEWPLSNPKTFTTKPLNDEYQNAITLSVNDTPSCVVTTAGSLIGATPSSQSNSCVAVQKNDVWFSFTANDSKQAIQFKNVTGTSPLLNYSVYNTQNLSLLYCNQPNQVITPTLTIGQTYLIRVWSDSEVIQDVNFNLCIKKITLPLSVSTTQYTPEQLVTQVLTNNPCIDISNVTSSTGSNFGGSNGIGYFTNPNIDPNFPAAGVVLSTGAVSYLPGPNTSLSSPSSTWPGDSGMQIPNTYNASKLEFDFTSQNTYMSFNFLFASDEYGGSWQCSFSDAFMFLLTDLTTNSTTNLAVVPNTTTPISVTTIRDNAYGPLCDSQNVEYFGEFFSQGPNSNSTINLNGQTVIMTAASQIIANHPYHIKMVIADRQDSVIDSAVFIQAGSFSVGPSQCSDKIKAIAFVDTNNNGIKEEGETNFTYGSFLSQQNNTGTVNTISSPIGSYSIYDENPANTYDIGYQVDPEYLPYFSAGTLNFNDLNIPVGSGTQTLYFPVTLIQQYNDVTVSIIPVSTPVAGATYVNKIVYQNLGVASASGTITFTKDPLSTITAIEQSGTVPIAGGFTYDFTNLAPYETRTFDVTMSLPPIPGVNIDDTVSNSAVISTPANDISLVNNSFINSQIVVASYDPNDKMEAHGGKIDINHFNQDDYLFYTIRFQNTGTSNAINIKIEDVLNEQLDESSIRMISASHDYVMERIGNHIIWKFNYIQLPGAIQNEALSNGYLTFKIKVKPGFVVGDIIPNTAAIYFDTNPAILTNTYATEFGVNLGNPDFTSGNIMVYPNPANSHVQISVMDTNESIAGIILYDMLGKTITTKLNVNSKTTAIDVSSLANGVYMIEITTENKLRQVKKLIIE